MKYILMLTALMLIMLSDCIVAQVGPNLVANPSFEIREILSAPPVVFNTPQKRTDFEGFVKDWFQTNKCCYQIPEGHGCPLENHYMCVSPDYFHQDCPYNCTNGGVSVPANAVGYQAAKHGVAYAGIITSGVITAIPPSQPCNPAWVDDANHVEFITVKLSQPLTIGKTYNVGFWASLAEISQYSMGKLGLQLSDADPTFTDCDMTDEPILAVGPGVNNSAIVSQPPPIWEKQKWHKISGEIYADHAYEYLTIGRFAPINMAPTPPAPAEHINFGIGNFACDAGTRNYSPFSYYYIDDSYVREKVCSCDALSIAILDNDAEVHCCVYFRINTGLDGLVGTNCSTLGQPSSIAGIRVTPCLGQLDMYSIELNPHFTGNPVNSLDHYIVDGDTYWYRGPFVAPNQPRNIKVIPKEDNYDYWHSPVRIPGFICLRDRDGNPLNGTFTVCLNFQFLDINGNVICEKQVSETFTCVSE